MPSGLWQLQQPVRFYAALVSRLCVQPLLRDAVKPRGIAHGSEHVRVPWNNSASNCSCCLMIGCGANSCFASLLSCIACLSINYRAMGMEKPLGVWFFSTV